MMQGKWYMLIIYVKETNELLPCIFLRAYVANIERNSSKSEYDKDAKRQARQIVSFMSKDNEYQWSVQQKE